MRPRLSVGLKIFSMPTLQLGDIVTIEYFSNQKDQLSVQGKRFVVYNIEYSRTSAGPDMTIYAVEV
jgi:hypothetical protein